MRFSDNAMSVILLCSYIGISKANTLKPLSLGEWNEFLEKIIEKKIEPSIVLGKNNDILKELNYSDEYIERIRELVSRAGTASFDLYNMENKGVKVVTVFDVDYPVLLKKKLKKKAPPVLFYVGDISLAKKIGIAVVGSRNVDDVGIEFTKKLVQKAAEERLIVYSGGAKGVDSISESTAIQNGSAVVSFIADSLEAKIKKREVFDNIIQGKLLLISDVKPDVGFSAARAMNRNKYIYAAAYGAFVVSSDYNKGGTWNGAVENIKNTWTKELVWNYKEYNGNLKLIEQGAISFELGQEKIYDVIMKKENNYNQINLFGLTASVGENPQEYNKKEYENKKLIDNQDIYEIVKNHIVENLGDGLSLDQAADIFKVAKEQMKIWFKRLCFEEKVKFEDGIYLKKYI